MKTAKIKDYLSRRLFFLFFRSSEYQADKENNGNQQQSVRNRNTGQKFLGTQIHNSLPLSTNLILGGFLGRLGFSRFFAVNLFQGGVGDYPKQSIDKKTDEVGNIDWFDFKKTHSLNPLVNFKLLYQKTKEATKPRTKSTQSISLVAMGAITNPAKKTWPISREISANAFNCFEFNLSLLVKKIFDFTKKLPLWAELSR